MNFSLFLIHRLEGLIDRLSLRYTRKGRFLGVKSTIFSVGLLLSLLLGLGMTADIRGALQSKNIHETKAPSLPPYLKAFRADLPAQHQIQGERLFHNCKTPVSATLLAKKYYKYSRVYLHSELTSAIIKTNQNAFRKNGVCIQSKRIEIPQPLLRPLTNEPMGISLKTEARAIYLQGHNARPHRLVKHINKLKQSRGNAIVFDVKDIGGVVTYRSMVAEVEKYRSHAPVIPDISKTIDYMHRRGIYVIARMACFQDTTLLKARTELAIRNKGQFLTFHGQPIWVDPGREEVQMYNLKIVAELIALGVDEIQLDYIRYPAEGDLSQVRYHKVKKPEDKTEHLVRFLSRVWMLRQAFDSRVKASIDIFGIIAWGENVDIAATGQRVEKLAPYVDVISPMLYPSHFSRGYNGYANPADEGYAFYKEGVQRILAKTGDRIVVRPWLQAFKWRTSPGRYSPAYIREQIKGSEDGGGIGWLLWNAGNKYAVPYQAMKTLPRVKIIPPEEE